MEDDLHLEDLLNNQKQLKLKKRIKLLFLFLIVIIIISIIIIIIVVATNDESEKTSEEDDIPDVFTEFNLSTFFYFDPVTKNPCNKKNYWTPFDNSTTCYRFVSITNPDTNKSNTIRIMLDHNIGKSNFSNYENILKNLTLNWSRYKGKIDIIDEPTLFNLMKYPRRANKTSNSKNSLRLTHFYSQSYYINKGVVVNEKGFWTKNTYDEDSSYAYGADNYGREIVVTKSFILGLRPVLNIKKSLLTIDPGVIDITNIIKNSTKIHYGWEDAVYDGFYYGWLQGMTVTNDKLMFMSSNNNNPEKSVMYSYKLNDLKNIYKKDYNNTGHGSGMTYNSKTDKVLVTGSDNIIYEYNGQTLIREKEYEKSKYPVYVGIGYDYNNDLYIGKYNIKLFWVDTIKMTKLYEFGVPMFETQQDLEYYNGYVFDAATDFGAPSKYQVYSFYEGYQLIYVYDAHLDKNNNPTKNFGRLIGRFIMKGFGELESLSFRHGYAYIGFAQKGYNFYKIEYNKLISETKIFS